MREREAKGTKTLLFGRVHGARPRGRVRVRARGIPKTTCQRAFTLENIDVYIFKGWLT